jgi:putative NIF3 family GTP cyclohydrolase 1 type 2
VAVCPGAGGSVFEQVDEVDLLVTGEMRHHDVLSRASQGTSVILTDHTNSERGFLASLAKRLTDACLGLEVSVSKVDRDPLQIT